LKEVLRDAEQAAEQRGEPRIIMRNSTQFVRVLLGLCAAWEEEGRRDAGGKGGGQMREEGCGQGEERRGSMGAEESGEEGEEEVMQGTLDFKALFPSVQHAYAIREIDELLLERIERAGEQFKREAVRLREIIMPLLIFVLEHQFVYVLSDQ